MSRLLVVAETDGSRILPSTLPTLGFAQAWARVSAGAFDLLIAGGPGMTESAVDYGGFGAERVFVCAMQELAHPVADRVAAVCAQACRESGANSLAGPSSTFGRDILPRAAALLDLPMISDVLSLEERDGRLVYRRPMYAGGVIATVELAGDHGVFSVRGTAFRDPAPMDPPGSLTVDPAALPAGSTWIGLDSPEQTRPELTTARVVVSGGRPLRDAETYERLIGGLADKLGGATGATRAAVDSEIAPNELQVGQTGKVVAPDLYIAAGISGSIQHLAGMKDSRVIVAINTDPDAPILEVADYGLVADLHRAIPEMIQRLP